MPQMRIPFLINMNNANSSKMTKALMKTSHSDSL